MITTDDRALDLLMMTIIENTEHTCECIRCATLVCKGPIKGPHEAIWALTRNQTTQHFVCAHLDHRCSMSRAASSRDDELPFKLIRVRKMNGDEFDVRIPSQFKWKTPWRVKNLKRAISTQEHSGEDSSDLATDERVLSPTEDLHLKIAEAGIKVSVLLAMKKEDPIAEARRCLICKAPNRYWEAVALCQDCQMQQIRLEQRYERYRRDQDLARALADAADAYDADAADDDDDGA